jgi:hypothetical protein
MLHRNQQNRNLRRSEDIMFSGPFAYLKHHLSESIQDAFFDAQDAKK